MCSWACIPGLGFQIPSFLTPSLRRLPFSPGHFFFFFFFYIYFWLCWVFVSVRGLSLVVASGGHSSSRCTDLSLSRPLLLRSTGSRHAGSVVMAHGPSCSAACGIFPDQGLNPCPLHWQADSQTLRHQGRGLQGTLKRPSSSNSRSPQTGPPSPLLTFTGLKTPRWASAPTAQGGVSPSGLWLSPLECPVPTPHVAAHLKDCLLSASRISWCLCWEGFQVIWSCHWIQKFLNLLFLAYVKPLYPVCWQNGPPWIHFKLFKFTLSQKRKNIYLITKFFLKLKGNLHIFSLVKSNFSGIEKQ